MQLCLKILFPFSLVTIKLIGDYFYNRQYAANCLVHFSFQISFVNSDQNDWGKARIEGHME
jgi:hypothetical protein